MGLQSGGDSVVVVGSCGGDVVLEAPLNGGGGSVWRALLEGGGGGGGHTSYPVTNEIRPVSITLVHGARVLVGRPLGPIWICVVFLYIELRGRDLGTGMTWTDSLSSSFSATATSTTASATMAPSAPSFSPSLGVSDDNTELLGATG
jgi:hypothetical protein